MLHFLYTGALYIAAPIALATLIVRGVRNPAYRGRVTERLGYARASFASPPIWVHAVSVGEVQAASVLIRALRARYPRHPILVTTATPTGAQRVQALFDGEAAHAYLPYDTPTAVRRFLDRIRPRIAIVMEREIWPNLFRECARRGVPVVLASARISAASAARHRKLASLFRAALERNVAVAAQTEADAARYRALGADSQAVCTIGNLKFDLEISDETRRAGAALREAFAGRPVWTAGSTHPGEEQIVLDAHRKVRAERPDALLILAPRHPDRFGDVAAWLTHAGVKFAARSAGVPIRPDHEVLLGDTLGELTSFYAASDLAFVGGSLAPIGGHNLLEPAALGLPIIVGPHNFNAQEIADSLLAVGAAQEVHSADQLARRVLDLFGDPGRAREIGARGADVIASNRGALERLMTLIGRRLAERGG